MEQLLIGDNKNILMKVILRIIPPIKQYCSFHSPCKYLIHTFSKDHEFKF